MRAILIVVLGLLFATCAQAQTGSVKTQTQLNTEIGTTGCTQPTCLWPDNTTGLITPFDLRQVGLDLTATLFGYTIAPAQCPQFTSLLSGCVPASGGGTTNYLRADGTWATPPSAGVNVQSGNYTIATSDCNGTVLANGTLNTITLPSSAGFSAPCTITVKNSNASRAQKLSGFPAGIAVNAINWCGSGNMCLPPNQSVQVQLAPGGAWFATQVIDRWRPNGVIIYADAANGSDNSDCLASGAAACATLQQAYNIACIFTDSQSTTIISFTGTMHNFLSGGCGVPRLIQINGTGTAIIDDNNTPGNAFECDDTCTIQLGAGSAVTVEALATGSSNVTAQRGGILDISNTTFTTTAGATAAIVKSLDGANVNLNSSNTFQGGGGTTIGFFANAARGGHIVTGAAQTVTGTWTVTDGCVASSTGVVDASGGAFSGGTVTGNRATATTAGGVNGATSCPGNANTTAVAPGWLN